MADYQYALHRKYHTHPTFTMYAPILVNVPMIILLSITIRTALAMPGSPMASESFMWLPSLAASDMALGLIGGAVLGTNAEIVAYKRDPSPWSPGIGSSSDEATTSTSSPMEMKTRSPSSPRSPPHRRARVLVSSSDSRRQLATLPNPASSSTPLAEGEAQLVDSSKDPGRGIDVRKTVATGMMRIGAIFFLCVASQVPSVSQPSPSGFVSGPVKTTSVVGSGLILDDFHDLLLGPDPGPQSHR